MKSVINNTMKLVSTMLLAAVFSANVMAGSYGKKMDIVDTAANNSDFSTLVAAVKAAGLVDALKADSVCSNE
jgi:uncharacterized surface protein with fasciclin (FAS1) repeats